MESTPVGKHRTRQRDVIARVIGDAAGPLSVNEILERAQRELAGLGVVTVYRTLKLLKEGGQVRTVVLPSGEPRYEPAARAHHHHFHCRACDAVYDLPGCPLPLPATREVSPGFIADGHEVTFFGTCPGCAG
ncbi:MAG TPA: transcriptional repressor [Longimicrobium sp.]|nr:transcriptional repressor [Longimicrobium sp.]